jgi:hypothetical protein
MPRRSAFAPAILLSLLLLLAAGRGVAATTPAVNANANLSTADRVRERVLRMTEFFDTMLPGVLEEHNMTLHFKPKFGDLRDYEYIRFPMELRYGLTDKTEIRAGIVPFTPNPINRGHEHRWGPGEVKFGVRYDLGKLLNFFDDTTIGFETRVPLGRPPVDLNDHYTHVKPFVSAARQLLTWPSTTFYVNLAYDRSVDLTHRSPPPAMVVRRNIVEVAPGLLFKPSELGYFAEYRFRHIREDFGWHLGHETHFGAIWDVPLARSQKWRLPGKWQLELGYKIHHEEGRDRSHGVAGRVNWRTSLKEVLSHTRSAITSR